MEEVFSMSKNHHFLHHEVKGMTHFVITIESLRQADSTAEEVLAEHEELLKTELSRLINANLVLQERQQKIVTILRLETLE
jgi:hypothetical protein